MKKLDKKDYNNYIDEINYLMCIRDLTKSEIRRLIQLSNLISIQNSSIIGFDNFLERYKF